MDKTQEEKFEKAKNKYYHDSEQWHGNEFSVFESAWQACLEANGIGEEPNIPEGYFKIGEKAIGRYEGVEYNGYIAFCPTNPGHVIRDPSKVRRAPAWVPKDGEAVFANNNGDVLIARVMRAFSNKPSYDLIFQDGDICSGGPWEIKPFDDSKIGKPWSEI